MQDVLPLFKYEHLGGMSLIEQIVEVMAVHRGPAHVSTIAEMLLKR